MPNESKIAKAYINKISNAESRGIEFSLSFAEYKRLYKAKKCQYTGVVMTIPVGGQSLKGTDRTFDRYDGGLGYVKGNVYVCCHSMNKLKENLENPDNSLTLHHLQKLVKFIEGHDNIDNTGKGSTK